MIRRGRHRAGPPARRGGRVLVASFAIVLSAVGSGGAAFAFWSSADSSNPARSVADALPGGATPATPTTNTPNGTTVTVSFARVTTAGNVPVTAYALKRYPAAGGAAVSVTASCTIASGTVTCVESAAPDGKWRYTDTPTYGATWIGVESGTSPVVTVDSTPPTVAMTDPGSPLRGTVTLTATATDATSGVTGITIRRAPAGTSNWTTVCTATTAPYICSWDTTTVNDGPYDFTATAVDAAGNTASAATVSARTVDNVAPFVTVAGPATGIAAGTVTLTATASDVGTGVTSIAIQQRVVGTTTWTTVCTRSTAPFSPYSCSWNTTGLTNDYYELQAVATDGASHTGTSAIIEIQVDNAAPTVTMTDPGSPLRGTVLLSATASDADSGVASVTIQYSLSGANSWATVCTSTTAPYSCYWNTTSVADGTYDFRATATDNAGNAATPSTVINRKVDNSQSSVTMLDPGAYLRGTATVAADASSQAGIVSVSIQYAPAGTTAWTEICKNSSTSPLPTTTHATCTWNTALVADGLYDLRAVLVDGGGKTTTSTTVATRRVDNTALRGWDVQAANGNATLGRIEANDTITFTYNEEVNKSTVLTGWAGGATSVFVRVRDGGLTGTGATGDVLDVFLTQATTTPVNLGSVNLHGDFAKGGRTVWYPATMVSGTTTVNGVTSTTVTITMQAALAGGSRTEGTAANMTWTPSAVVTDLNVPGNPCSAAPVTELGTLDKDF